MNPITEYLTAAGVAAKMGKHPNLVHLGVVTGLITPDGRAIGPTRNQSLFFNTDSRLREIEAVLLPQLRPPYPLPKFTASQAAESLAQAERDVTEAELTPIETRVAEIVEVFNGPPSPEVAKCLDLIREAGKAAL
jgi:hypothetical protein